MIDGNEYFIFEKDRDGYSLLSVLSKDKQFAIINSCSGRMADEAREQFLAAGFKQITYREYYNKYRQYEDLTDTRIRYISVEESRFAELLNIEKAYKELTSKNIEDEVNS